MGNPVLFSLDQKKDANAFSTLAWCSWQSPHSLECSSPLFVTFPVPLGTAGYRMCSLLLSVCVSVSVSTKAVGSTLVGTALPSYICIWPRMGILLTLLSKVTNNRSFTHSNSNSGVGHAGRLPDGEEQSGWGVSGTPPYLQEPGQPATLQFPVNPLYLLCYCLPSVINDRNIGKYILSDNEIFLNNSK